MVKKKIRSSKVFFILVIIIIIMAVLISKLSSEINMSNDGSVALIPVQGVITLGTSSGVPFQQSLANAVNIVESIKIAKETDSIKAVVLDINSPGGTAVASKQIADALKDLDKPVVAVIREIGTSGAYWVASASDFIVADELSITGSIGVIGSYLDFSELFDDYGVEYQRLVSGKYKDLGSPYKELTGDEEIVLQDKIDDVHDYFVNEVKTNRNVDNGELFTGVFFLGSEAKILGLIDEFGSIEKGVEIAKNLANITEGDVVEFREEKGLFDFFSRLSASAFYFMGKGIGNELMNTETNFNINLK